MGSYIVVSPAAAAREAWYLRLAPLSRAVAAAFGSVSLGLAAQTVADAPAGSEAQAGAASPAGAQKIESVVITATRRREPVREVPMQVNTLNAEALERGGAKSLRDYLANEAGIDVKSEGGTGIGGVSMRGVTTGDQTSASVGIYVDEVAAGSSSSYVAGSRQAVDLGLLDLHHIEVLRGPQGTLYGAGAMGGVLKYVTNEPDAGAFSGKVGAGLTAVEAGRAGNRLNAVVNVPFSQDVAAMRVSAFREEAGGYVDAVGPAAGADVNRGKSTGARVSALVMPADRLKLRLTATTQKIERDGRDAVDVDPRTGRSVEGDLKRRLWLAEPYDNKFDLYSLDVEYDLGWARVNAVTGRQTLRTHQIADASGVYRPLLASLGLPVATVGFASTAEVKRTTQEFRFTSRSDRQFEWLFGLYYDKEDGTNLQHGEVTFVNGAILPGMFDASLPSSYKEYAGYGDLTWKFSNGLAITGGLRAARNEQTYRQESDGVLLGGKQSIRGDSGETSKTYLLTARYALAAKSSVYARVASGYRPGGPNAVTYDLQTGRPTAPPTFDHDTLVSYEAGYKADLLDDSLSMQAAAYDVEWKNLQQYYTVNGVSVIVNAGRARVKGAELSAEFRPAAHWSLNANMAYIDARLTEDAHGLGATSGARLPSSARFSATLGARYTFDLFGAPAYAGVSARQVGERNAGFEGSRTKPNYKLPAYAMADVQMGIDFKRASLALYARNLFDRRAQGAANTTYVPFGRPVWVVFEQPRTVGVDLTVPF